MHFCCHDVALAVGGQLVVRLDGGLERRTHGHTQSGARDNLLDVQIWRIVDEILAKAADEPAAPLLEPPRSLT